MLNDKGKKGREGRVRSVVGTGQLRNAAERRGCTTGKVLQRKC